MTPGKSPTAGKVLEIGIASNLRSNKTGQTATRPQCASYRSFTVCGAQLESRRANQVVQALI
jgi:hypothetical protein